MTNPRKPFRLNVGFIVNNDVGFSVDFPFDFDRIKVSDDLDLCNFRGTANIGRTPQGLLLTGQFEATLLAECARCLSEFNHTVHWEMTELYAFNKKSVTDSGLVLPDDAQIDLAPLIRDYALTEIPISPICKDDCKGLCSTCGQDLNKKDCGHRTDSNDSPFSVLKDLLKN
jgi:uncharacterized protein